MVEIFRKNYFLWLSFSTISLFFLFSSTVSAQYVGGINIASSPKFPEPNEEMRVSISEYGVNTFGATINWYVNGVEKLEYRNERSMKFMTGDLGERSEVEVVISQTGGLALSTSRIFVPVLVDIILESETYVPYFYKGRALPSTEASLRAIAVVNDSESSPDSTYTYRWKLENSTLFGGPVKGKRVAELTVPRFGEKNLSVEVSDSDGNVFGKGSVPIQTQDLELYFYEENPLLGLSGKAIDGTLNLTGEETTIFGEPYYMRTEIGDTNVDFDWEINGRNAESGLNRKNMITLRSNGDSGSAQIDLDVAVTNSIPQFVRDAFRLVFN